MLLAAEAIHGHALNDYKIFEKYMEKGNLKLKNG